MKAIICKRKSQTLIKDEKDKIKGILKKKRNICSHKKI